MKPDLEMTLAGIVGYFGISQKWIIGLRAVDDCVFFCINGIQYAARINQYGQIKSNSITLSK